MSGGEREGERWGRYTGRVTAREREREKRDTGRERQRYGESMKLIHRDVTSIGSSILEAKKHRNASHVNVNVFVQMCSKHIWHIASHARCGKTEF